MSHSWWHRGMPLQGVCRIYPAVNQHRPSEIESCDEFWSYSKSESRSNLPNSQPYFAHIRALLAERGCVRCAFTAADQKLAASLLVNDVSLEQIERAIGLGCSRKYLSWLNGTDSGYIVSFSYFRDLIEETGDQDTPAGYWDFQKLQLKRLELKWIEKGKIAGANVASASAKKLLRRNDGVFISSGAALTLQFSVWRQIPYLCNCTKANISTW